MAVQIGPVAAIIVQRVRDGRPACVEPIRQQDGGEDDGAGDGEVVDGEGNHAATRVSEQNGDRHDSAPDAETRDWHCSHQVSPDGDRKPRTMSATASASTSATVR